MLILVGTKHAEQEELHNSIATYTAMPGTSQLKLRKLLVKDRRKHGKVFCQELLHNGGPEAAKFSNESYCHYRTLPTPQQKQTITIIIEP